MQLQEPFPASRRPTITMSRITSEPSWLNETQAWRRWLGGTSSSLQALPNAEKPSASIRSP